MVKIYDFNTDSERWIGFKTYFLLCFFVFVFNFYWSGNYLKFYSAIKQAYPDIKMISNCDGSSKQLDHPADFYDFHVIFLSSFLVFHRWMNLVNQFLCVIIWMSWVIIGWATRKSSCLTLRFLGRYIHLPPTCFLWLISLIVHHVTVQRCVDVPLMINIFTFDWMLMNNVSLTYFRLS